jgi:hypothetical protein
VNRLHFQSQEYVGEFRSRYNLAVAGLAYVIVLTKNATQIATGKENRSRTPAAADDRLFPSVNANAGDNRILGSLAKAELFNPICLAMPRADRTDYFAVRGSFIHCNILSA